MNPVVRFGLMLAVVVLVFGAVAGTAGAAETASNGQLVIELESNGDANAVFTDHYNLSNPSQRAVFEDAREDEALRASAETQFQEQMQAISDEASADLNREIRVSEVAIGITIDGNTGIVAYQYRWENLAVVEDDQVVLREPFSTYDSLDRELVVIAPEGDEIVSATPQPQRRGDDAVSWPGFSQFGEGFEVVTTRSGDTVTTAADLGAISHSGSTSNKHGGAPLALGVSLLLLVSLLVGRTR